MSAKIRQGIEFDPENGKPLQLGWNGSIRMSFFAFIPELKVFSQSQFGIPAAVGLSMGTRDIAPNALKTGSQDITTFYHRQ
ncbi:MAG: hypothetical protein JSW39_19525 [Desulfobacterales bacterium]|nr:MAG: hypothetical protein JSW39_19525 [Desulfobacterales bacterium]